MEAYAKGEEIGDGAFSSVYKAIHKESGRAVALKKVRMGKAEEGVHKSAIREVKALREIEHPAIIQLLDVFPHKQNLYLVYELMESDLEVMLKADRRFGEAVIKTYMRVVLEGLAFCHRSNLLHRDVKPNNLLIAADGSIKLADFGLARLLDGPTATGPMTPQISHLWYKPPELMLGEKRYGPGVDVWAAGCVFAELMLGRPLMKASSELEMLNKIFEQLGTPPDACYQGLSLYDCMCMFRNLPGVPFEETFAGRASPAALSLLRRLLDLDPATRISAQEALGHDYFHTGEAPAPVKQLPQPALWQLPSAGTGEGHQGRPGRGGKAFRAVLFKHSSVDVSSSQEDSELSSGLDKEGGLSVEETPGTSTTPADLDVTDSAAAAPAEPPTTGANSVASLGPLTLDSTAGRKEGDTRIRANLFGTGDRPMAPPAPRWPPHDDPPSAENETAGSVRRRSFASGGAAPGSVMSCDVGFTPLPADGGTVGLGLFPGSDDQPPPSSGDLMSSLRKRKLDMDAVLFSP